MIIFITKHWLNITAIVLISIATLSLWPVAQLPSVPGTDKTHHFIAYAALMFPTALRKPKHWLMVTFAFLTFSGAIELIQPYVNRYGEWLDLAANALGLLCGFILAKVLLLFCSKNNLPT